MRTTFKIGKISTSLASVSVTKWSNTARMTSSWYKFHLMLLIFRSCNGNSDSTSESSFNLIIDEILVLSYSNFNVSRLSGYRVHFLHL